LKKRKICLVITTRGNYAKMKSLIDLAIKDPSIELQLVIGGMVVLEKYGRLINQINKLNVKVIRQINFVVEGENLLTMSKSAGLAMIEFSLVFNELKPDIVMVIADRFECLPIAMAASYMNIFLAHIEGGEVSGSIDESIRHSITKLSNLHFPCSKEAGQRILKMGEKKDTIFVVGSTSFDVIRSINKNDLVQIRNYQKDYGIGAQIEIQSKGYITVIQHPVTSEYEDNFKNANKTLEAVVELNIPTIWILPNMDAGSDGVNKALRFFRDKNKNNFIHFYKSLPIEIFAPILFNSLCIVGNSSSGIRESEFLGIPSVNIGTRQNGRERGKNVIDVSYNKNEIKKAIKKQINMKSYKTQNIYGDGYASVKILKILKKIKLITQKTIAY